VLIECVTPRLEVQQVPAPAQQQQRAHAPDPITMRHAGVLTVRPSKRF
jgi:hypothetical protein